MAKKYYVVWKGRETGVFSDWETCKRQVYQFAGARYKSFASRELAESAFRKGKASVAPAKAASTRKPRSDRLKTWSDAEIRALDVELKLFTDGGCEPNPGEAGSGIAVYENNQVSALWYGLYHPNGTNNTAELKALDQALQLAAPLLDDGRSVAVFCDSSYAISCITQWAPSWQAKGWVRKGGEIKNLALIKPMFERFLALEGRLPIYHVNGHVGVEGNELADRMSLLAIAAKERGFVRYDEPIDVAAILARRSG